MKKKYNNTREFGNSFIRANCEQQNMLNQVHFQIVSKAASILLAARLQPHRPFFLTLQQKIHTLKNHPPPSLHALLSSIQSEDHHHLLQKIIKHSPQGRMSVSASVQVVFSLLEKATGVRREVEIWEICATRNKIGDNGQSNGMLLGFVEEVMLVLSRLPLLVVYRKEKTIRNAYVVDYKSHFQYHVTPSLLNLQAQHYLQRKDDSLSLYAKVFYCPSLSFLSPLKPEKIPQSPQSKRKHSLVTSDYGCDRKVSVYVFYDKDLDFTFLSSEQQMEGGSSEQFKTELTMEQVSSQFELLICQEDASFCDNNQDLFEELAHRQKKLFL